MNLFLYDHCLSEIYGRIKLILSRFYFEFLNEEMHTGQLSCFRDGQVLQLVDIKLKKTSNRINILIITSRLSHAKGILTADPELELQLTSALVKELNCSDAEMEFSHSFSDYFMAC